jgi:hypothetical protein
MMSAAIKIKNQLTLPSPRASDASFLGKSTNPDALGDDKSTLGKDQLDIVPNNVMTLVRKSIDDMCRNLKKEFRKKLGEICACMSPQDSFTFRLESRTVFEMFSMTTEPEEGDDGLHYDVYHSKCILGDPEFREFVESDGRYTVAWRHMVRAEAISRDYDGVIVFKPNIPLPHMEEGKGE